MNNIFFKNIFNKENIRYVHLKSNDFLLEHNNYYKSINILINKGFIPYMTEKTEKYKTMLSKFVDGKIYSIHLHREIAWHGILVLDKKWVIKRSTNNKPSKEDLLLIESGHFLFENFKFNKKQFDLLKSITNFDHEYVSMQLKKNGWKKEFEQLHSKIHKENRPFKLSKKNILKINISKIIKKRLILNSWNVSGEIVRHIMRKLRIRKKGYLVALIGVNGAGKSTTSKELTKMSKEFKRLGISQSKYYFGWKPFLPTTKILSKLFQKKGKNTYDDLNKKIKRFDIKNELIFLYTYFEYLARYIFHIYPKLRKKHIIISDRYFYDMFGQYKYSKNSLILPLLLKFYPKPDITIFLDANYNTIKKRRKNVPDHMIKSQKERFKQIAKNIDAKIFLTDKDFKDTVKNIFNTFSNACIKKLSK